MKSLAFEFGKDKSTVETIDVAILGNTKYSIIFFSFGSISKLCFNSRGGEISSSTF